jgi:hypothetical protein
MVVVFVWILMCMVTMSVIVRMRCEDLLYEIDEEEPCDKCIDCKLCFLESLGEYMDERDCEHRSGTESDEEIEHTSIHSLSEIEKESRGRDKCEDEEGENHIYLITHALQLFIRA